MRHLFIHQVQPYLCKYIEQITLRCQPIKWNVTDNRRSSNEDYIFRHSIRVRSTQKVTSQAAIALETYIQDPTHLCLAFLPLSRPLRTVTHTAGKCVISGQA